MQQMAKMGDPTDKIDFLLRKSSELLADMRRMERENQKNKKRGDTLQKEKDTNRTELTKTVTLKEKLEKLCRELQRDNNKLKVTSRTSLGIPPPHRTLAGLTLTSNRAEREQDAVGYA